MRGGWGTIYTASMIQALRVTESFEMSEQTLSSFEDSTLTITVGDGFQAIHFIMSGYKDLVLIEEAEEKNTDGKGVTPKLIKKGNIFLQCLFVLSTGFLSIF